MVAVAIPALPPAAPGPDAHEVRCPNKRCRALLGYVADGCLHLRHKGRGVDAFLPARVQCDRCGHKSAVLDSTPPTQ